MGPTSQRAAIVAGVELPVYDQVKKFMIDVAKLPNDMSTHFLSSFITGFCSCAISNPIDVVKVLFSFCFRKEKEKKRKREKEKKRKREKEKKRKREKEKKRKREKKKVKNYE